MRRAIEPESPLTPASPPSQGRFAIGTPKQFRWLYSLIQVVLILNLIDAILTLFWVRSGLAQEANVLLQTIVNEHPILFVLVKTSLVSMGSWLLWQRRRHPLAVIGLFVIFIVYYGLLLHHLRFASFVATILFF